MKSKICFIFGTAIPLIMDVLYGGWSAELETLVILMAIDYIIGTIAAAMGYSDKTKNGKLDSQVMVRGIGKKIVDLLLVSVCHLCDNYLGINYLMNVAIVSFIVSEIISMMETAANCGVNIKILNKVLELMQEKEEL